MKHGVNKQSLLLTAGIVWLVAGANILRIGLVTWGTSPGIWWLKATGAAAVFAVFYLLIFRRLYGKHARRIRQKQEAGNCPFGFFDAKGWIVMVVMISAGIAIRAFGLLPACFIAAFYTGLSLALVVTGVLFIRDWRQGRR